MRVFLLSTIAAVSFSACTVPTADQPTADHSGSASNATPAAAPGRIAGMTIRYTFADDTITRTRNDAMAEEMVPHLPKDYQWTAWEKASEDDRMFAILPMSLSASSTPTGWNYLYRKTAAKTAILDAHTLNGNGGGRIWLIFDGPGHGVAHASTATRHIRYQYKNLRFELTHGEVTGEEAIDSALQIDLDNGHLEPIPGIP
jgi:hypothetical protein